MESPKIGEIWRVKDCALGPVSVTGTKIFLSYPVKAVYGFDYGRGWVHEKDFIERLPIVECPACGQDMILEDDYLCSVCRQAR